MARERDRDDVQKKRRQFVVEQPTLDPERLRFLDESGFRLGSPPHYGWAPRGEKTEGKSTQGSWETMTRETFEQAVATAMGAITTDNICAWLQHAGYSVA